jgi:hypothetical protein
LIAACLLAAICDPASARPGFQQDPGAVEAIRQDVAGFLEKDLLRLRLHDGSERVGCLKGVESDGLLIGIPKGAVLKLLYSDIAAVAREQPRRPNFLRRVVIPVAALAGVIFGTVKTGSNTPKTVFVKVELGSAAGMIVMQASSPRVPICR